MLVGEPEWVKLRLQKVSTRIVDGDVPDNLKIKLCFHLTWGAIAGAKLKGI
jgi:ATP-dependent Clp protease ATP-binding subunit ClpA